MAIRVDVRVVAATNRDLRAAIAAGRFREDLFYRLAVFPIDVSPLRDRMQDCSVLVDGFVRVLARRLGKPIDGVTEGATARLLRYDWPGNVRELANVLERAAIVARGTRITDADLPALVRTDPTTNALAVPPTQDPASDRLENVERAHILGVLQRTSWTIEGKGGAAAALGLAPSTLRSRMAQLGIARSTMRR
jgi:transcriptional regulator with GAF, ATPase, and Fis domain